MQSQSSVRSKKIEWTKRIVFYVLGLLILALAVSISVKSNLGVSPVSSVPLVFSNVSGIELGNMTIIVFCVYVLVQIVILRKAFPPVQLLQVVCAVLFGKFVTLTGAVIKNWVPSTYIEQLLMIVLATVLIATGIKLYLLAGIIPQAADGLVDTITRKTGRKLANIKNFFDLGSVALSCAVSLIFTGKLIGIREGTVIAAIGVGRVIALLNKIDNNRLHEFVYRDSEREVVLKSADAKADGTGSIEKRV